MPRSAVLTILRPKSSCGTTASCVAASPVATDPTPAPGSATPAGAPTARSLTAVSPSDCASSTTLEQAERASAKSSIPTIQYFPSSQLRLRDTSPPSKWDTSTAYTLGDLNGFPQSCRFVFACEAIRDRLVKVEEAVGVVFSLDARQAVEVPAVVGPAF